MVFASPIFLFLFLPITLLGYYLIHPKFRNFWLFLMSFIFYAWGGLSYALILLFSTLMNYLFGILIDKSKEKYKKSILILSIVYNLGILGFFKYFSFILYNIQEMIRIFIPQFTMEIPKISLPIGISFFTFQIMSYVIDLYRKEIRLQKSFLNLGLYIMLFPQLIAGPIVRYIDVEKEIYERKVDIDKFYIGLKRFVLGLGKKVLIANAMGSWADYAFTISLDKLSTPLAWLGIFGYTMQIYFDFSAYSDMAIGLGKMFGFDFLENFNYPYISQNIQEFWRRWHMSLSGWFRDYLYIPLGGNRKGKKKAYINSFIVFFCTGLWHGAAWNFIFWGLFHGIFLIIEKIGFGDILKRLPRIFRHIYTLLVVIIGWVFFRAEAFTMALRYLKRLFIFDFNKLEYFFLGLDNWKIFMGLCAIIFSLPSIQFVKKYLTNNIKESFLYELSSMLLYTMLFLISICFITGSSFNPFIYFRF